MDVPVWITERRHAEIRGCSVSLLRNDRWRKRGVPYYKDGSAVKYRLDEVLAAMESRRVETRTAS